MKITIITTPGEFDDHYEEMLAASVDGSDTVGQLGNFEGQGEDATFCREIKRPRNYLKIITMAYEAGKRQENLEIEYKIEED